jgi:quercetin dioxygenase-like cupin family protein
MVAELEAFIAPGKIDALEAALIDQPQVEIPVRHDFAPGLYVRRALMPAGSVVVGHRHRETTLNFLLRGKLLVIVDGQRHVLTAPCVLTSEAGTRKAALILEDVEWVNVHPNPTNETNPERLAEIFIEKSETFLAHEARELAVLVHPQLEE